MQNAWRAFLLAAIAWRKNRLTDAQEFLKEAETLSTSRDLVLLRALVLYLQMRRSSSPTEIVQRGAQVQRYVSTLHPHDRRRFDGILSELGLFDSASYFLLSDKRQKMDSFGLAQVCAASENLVLDLVHKQVFENGKKQKGPPPSSIGWKLIEVLALRRPAFASKEELATKVFGVKTYHPLRDDNRIYVALSRLRKSLGKREIVEAGPDGYRITPAPTVWVVLERE